MKFEIKKSDFLSALERAVDATDSKLGLDSFSSIKISVSGPTMTIEGTSPGIFISASAPISRSELAASEELVGHFNSKRFLEVVKSCDDAISVKVTDKTVRLSGGGSTFTVNKLGSADLPKRSYPNMTRDMFTPIDAKGAATVVKRASESCTVSEDEATSSVFVTPDSVWCTNKVVLSRADNKWFKMDTPVAFSKDILLRGLKSMSIGDSNASHAVHDGELHLLSGDTNVVLSQISVSVPPYRRLTDMYLGAPCSLCCDRRELIEALSKVSLALDPKGDTRVIRLSFDSAQPSVSLSCKSQFGDAFAKVQCSVCSVQGEMLFGPDLLVKGLKQFTGREVYAKILADTTKAVMFYEDGYEFYANPRRA